MAAARARLAEAQRLVLGVHGLDDDFTGSLVEGELDALGKTLVVLLVEDEAIDHEVDSVLAFLVEGRSLLEPVKLAVHADADVPAADEALEQLAELALAMLGNERLRRAGEKRDPKTVRKYRSLMHAIELENFPGGSLLNAGYGTRPRVEP